MNVIEIDVTEEDIKRGIRYFAFNCPIALAASRTLGLRVCVGVDRFTVNSTGEFYELSPEGKEFRRNFDTKRPVSPCKFKATLESIG